MESLVANADGGDSWAKMCLPSTKFGGTSDSDRQPSVFTKASRIRPMSNIPGFSEGAPGIPKGGGLHAGSQGVSVIEGWCHNLSGQSKGYLDQKNPSLFDGEPLTLSPPPTKTRAEPPAPREHLTNMMTFAPPSRPTVKQDPLGLPAVSETETPNIFTISPPIWMDPVNPSTPTVKQDPLPIVSDTGTSNLFTISRPIWMDPVESNRAMPFPLTSKSPILINPIPSNSLETSNSQAPHTASSSPTSSKPEGRAHFNVLVPYGSVSPAPNPWSSNPRGTSNVGHPHHPMGPRGVAVCNRNQTTFCNHNNASYEVPDLRSIASGALVDIDIPPSCAASFISITGSQTTLLSSASSCKWNSVRRSVSADSLLGLKNSSVELQPPNRRLPPDGSTTTDDNRGNFRLSIKRASSVDQLGIVSPYPMPPISKFTICTKENEHLVRTLSLEERASLALSLEEPICRICWQGEDSEPCIQSCYCNTFVHRSCVQRWLHVAKITCCEVCRYQYKATRKMKPISQWRWWPNKNRHLAQLEATIILLGVVTPPLLCGIILCSQKITEYLRSPDNAWKTAGLMTLVMVSVATYLGAVLYFCHKFATVCKNWVTTNRTTVVAVAPLSFTERRPPVPPAHIWTIT